MNTLEGGERLFLLNFYFKLEQLPQPEDRATGDDDEPEHQQFKIILLGDGAVGKTSIAMRFTDDSFGKNYKQTIGLDFFVKRLTLPPNLHVAISLWDIGGQTIGSKMITSYIHGAHAVLLCYDITNYQTFQNLEDWLELVRRTFQNDPLPYLALIGNKTDLSHLRTVKLDRHNKFATDNGMHPFFMSAKTGDNVAATMHRITAALAGVTLSKPEIEMAGRGVRAEIVNHPQHEVPESGIVQRPSLPPAPSTEPPGSKPKKDSCTVQ